MGLRFVPLGAALIGAALTGAVAPGAGATTLTTSLAAFQAGVNGAAVVSSPNPGNYDLTQLFLPTTSSIVLADGQALSLGTSAQVSQAQNGFPYDFADGFAGTLFIPVDANGNQVSTELVSLGGGINALGFEVAPFSAAVGQPNFGVPSGPFSVTVTIPGGQSQTVTLPGGDFTTGTTQPQFFGFFGGGVSSLLISTTDPEGLAFGNFVDVPGPASSALLLGLGVAVLVRRRHGAA